MARNQVIALYKPFLVQLGGEADCYFAVDKHSPNLPTKLHCFGMPLRGNGPARFDPLDEEIHSINDKEEEEAEIVFAGKTGTVAALPADRMFSHEAHKEMLRRRGIHDLAEIREAALNSIVKTIGPLYPDAAVSIADGCIKVESPTSIPCRVQRAATSQGRFAKTRRSHRLHVWI